MIDLNKPYKTKCGKEVTLIRIMKDGEQYPVIGFVKNGLYTDPHLWTLDGKFLSYEDDDYDLIEQNTIKQEVKQCD